MSETQPRLSVLQGHDSLGEAQRASQGQGNFGALADEWNHCLLLVLGVEENEVENPDSAGKRAEEARQRGGQLLS